ncbi:MAG: glycosyltransferase family 2 protein [Candidatus Lambdaproteobacteria bacterium]|nr:glycosyltransferase family 2 protein [Candidatus Lambdaproteobacteria bacterium]
MAPARELSDELQAPRKDLISIVVPVFCEEDSLDKLVRRVAEIMSGVEHADYEIVFVNDGSTDRSLAKLNRIAATDRRYKIVDLMRNFGKEAALSAGLRYARGDAVVCMDADMQHPPEFIPAMISHWRAGAELVATYRKSYRKHPLLRRMASRIFYLIMNRISETRIFAQSTDFCLVDRAVVDTYNAIGEKERSFRGLLDWLGSKRAWIEFVADEREHGRPAYSYAKLFDLAITNLILYSSRPLKLIILFGLLISVTSALLLIWMVFWTALDSQRFVYTPLATFVVGNTFMNGLVLTTLGVIALYIAKINREVSDRPLFVVRSLTNIEGSRSTSP